MSIETKTETSSHAQKETSVANTPVSDKGWFYYFTLGILVTVISGSLAIKWTEMGGAIFGATRAAYDRQPEWYHTLGEFVGAFPLIAGAILLNCLREMLIRGT